MIKYTHELHTVSSFAKGTAELVDVNGSLKVTPTSEDIRCLLQYYENWGVEKIFDPDKVAAAELPEIQTILEKIMTTNCLPEGESTKLVKAIFADFVRDENVNPNPPFMKDLCEAGITENQVQLISQLITSFIIIGNS